MMVLVDDFQALLTEARNLKDYIRDLTNPHVSLFALKESKQSIRLADSVRRLSILAFIFLPLSFSSSLFGMNVRELSNTPLRAFVATAVTMTIVSILLWRAFGAVSRSTLSRRVLLLWIRTLWRFAHRSPWHAVALAFFVIFHNPDDATEVLRDLGFINVLIVGADNNGPASMRGNRFSSVQRDKSLLALLWQKIVRSAAKFTDREGWKDDFFYRRLFPCYRRDFRKAQEANA